MSIGTNARPEMYIMVDHGLFVFRICKVGFLITLSASRDDGSGFGPYLDVPEVRCKVITFLAKLKRNNFMHDVPFDTELCFETRSRSNLVNI
jgi:hypothetical protein